MYALLPIKPFKNGPEIIEIRNEPPYFSTVNKQGEEHGWKTRFVVSLKKSDKCR